MTDDSAKALKETQDRLLRESADLFVERLKESIAAYEEDPDNTRIFLYDLLDIVRQYAARPMKFDMFGEELTSLLRRSHNIGADICDYEDGIQ